MMDTTTDERLEMDLMRIFLTPPNTRREKITLAMLLLITFVMFFGPICFSDLHPMKAILLACMPSVSLSWGWTVLLRALFRKREFSRK